MLDKDIEKILITREEIQNRCSELGKELTEIYKDKNPLVVGVLKGAVPFMADIVREMDCHLELDFMDVSSYGNATISSGTLAYLVDLFKYRKAKSVKIVTLLDKPEGRVVKIDADYIGFDVPNEFVVGYGLDYAEQYRNLPYVGVLKPSVYQSN